MLSFVTTLITSGISQYGTAMSMNPRHAPGTMYTRLMEDIASYSNEGAKIMIDNAWMEQQLMASDRRDLATKSNE